MNTTAESGVKLPVLAQPGAWVFMLASIIMMAAWVKFAGERAAMSLALAAYAPLLLSRGLRTSLPLTLAFAAVVTSHHLVSLVNAYWNVLPDSIIDAGYYHNSAVTTIGNGMLLPPNLGIGTSAYKAVLTLLYSALGASLLLGQQLSIFVTVMACLIIWRMMILAGVGNDKYQAMGLLLASLLPSILLFGSLTLREPFELLFLTFGTLAVTMALQQRSLVWLVVAITSFVMMGLFHQVLLFTGIGLALLAICWYAVKTGATKGRHLFKVTASVLFFVFTATLFVWIMPAPKGNNYLGVLDKGFTQSVVQYRDAVDTGQPRTAYGFDVSPASIPEFTRDILRSWFAFVFGPLPGQQSDFSGFVMTSEAMIRIIGLLSMLVLAIRWSGVCWFPAMVFMVMTFVWSIGTTNYGQAFRHHSLTGWIPVIYFILFIDKHDSDKNHINNDSCQLN